MLIFKCSNAESPTWTLLNDPSKSFTDIQPIMVKKINN